MAEPVIYRSTMRDVKIPNVSAFDFISGSMSQFHPNRTALYSPETKKQLTYQGVLDLTAKFAAGLQARGVKPQDVVAIALSNCPEYAPVFLGILACGATVTTINPAYTSSEIKHQMGDCKAKMIVTSSSFSPTVREGSKVPLVVINDGSTAAPGSLSFDEFVANDGVFQKPMVRLDDAAVLPYSSGTTGLPKGVVLTHRNIVANLCQMAAPDLMDSKPDEVVMATLPMFHIYGMVIVLFGSLCCGSKIVSLSKFDPEPFLSAIQSERCSLLYLAPPLVNFLLKHPLVAKYDLTSVRDIVCGAAPLSEELGAGLANKLGKGVTVRQAYGMSELSPLATAMPRVVNLDGNVSSYKRYESVGYLVPNMELMINRTDPKDPPNEGEMLLRGPNVMLGYLGNEEATRATIRPDGFMHTGDVIRRDDDGALYCIDRMKELIKVKGFQVAPAELEAKLKAHPAVFQAGVIGIADERAGEAPKAFVQLNPDIKPGSITPQELIKFAATDLSDYKTIKEIEFWDEVPATKSGKILRRTLRDYQKNKLKAKL